MARWGCLQASGLWLPPLYFRLQLLSTLLLVVVFTGSGGLGDSIKLWLGTFGTVTLLSSLPLSQL